MSFVSQEHQHLIIARIFLGDAMNLFYKRASAVHVSEVRILAGKLCKMRLTIGCNTVGTQNKSYLVALKLAQFDFLHQCSGETPILLLDDIFDKLDSRRVEQIVKLVSGERFGQIFITDVNRDHIDTILECTDGGYKLFEVAGGGAQIIKER